MPPFRKGPIIVSRRFSADALHELRERGHGHRFNVVDASYPIPPGARTITFPGTTAEALLDIARIIPIEDNSVTLMDCDTVFDKDPMDSVNKAASNAAEDIAATLQDDDSPVELTFYERRRLTEEEEPGELGFYELADDPSQAATYVRTIDPLPFACLTFRAGHSQRTE